MSKAAALVGLLGVGLLMTRATQQPRGIANNNPLNIREAADGGDLWRGERLTNDDPDFEEFNRPEDGIRAAVVIIKNYRRRYGIHTLAGIINRWAPSNENDTENYIRRVSQWSGIAPGQVVTDDKLPLLVQAMIRMETGVKNYPMETIQAGVALA